ncbi:MAG: GTPase [Alphaproteobacteria bacterium]
MRIRTFTAPTMSEAMHLVRDAMGEDAIIVSTHQGRRGRGVEVRAAVEAPPSPAASRQVAATLDEVAELETRLAARLRGELENPPTGGTAKPTARHPVADGKALDRKDLDLKEVGQALVFHRLPSALGKAMLQDAKRFDVDSGEEALAAAIDMRFGFAPLPDAPRRPLMLIGPPGVGKTASAAKLAARAVLSGASVSLVTTDTVKAGGIAQMEAFAGLLEAPCHAADSPDALSAVLGRPQEGPTIVDTPGTNPFNRAEREDLIAFLKAFDVEPVLVLAAGADGADMADTARIFQEMGARRVIITRLDVARRLGSVLWLLHTTGLALAQGSRTPYVADGLVPMDPSSLARLIMGVPRSSLPSPPRPASDRQPPQETPAFKESFAP